MIIKPGVRLLGLRPETVFGLLVADGVLQREGVERVLTSGTEGVHKRASAHYSGHAGDLRRPVDQARAVAVTEKLRAALGEDFDVVLESDHIHVEFQPKRPY